MLKKIISLLMSVIMCATLCVPAVAANIPSTTTYEINLNGVDYTQTIAENSRTITSIMENENVCYRSVYDKVENTISFYQYDLTATASTSNIVDPDTPDIFIDLNQTLAQPLIPDSVMGGRTCLVYYASEFWGMYYAYTYYDNDSYDILHDTDPIVLTPPGVTGSMARTCQSYYSVIKLLDSDCDNATESTANFALDAFGTAIPLVGQIKTICEIVWSAANGTFVETTFMATLTSMISGLPGLKDFGLIVSAGKLTGAWVCLADDIWTLGDIYKEIYEVYG